MQRSNLRITHSGDNPEGIRDDSGFLFLFTKVQKYENQQERYARECEEQQELAEYLLAALKDHYHDGYKEQSTGQDYINLKWGTLKGWDFKGPKVIELMKQYCELGVSIGCATQSDTPEQKELICKMIDECNAPTIHLDWHDVDVSKDEAKRYVMEYGKNK